MIVASLLAIAAVLTDPLPQSSPRTSLSVAQPAKIEPARLEAARQLIRLFDLDATFDRIYVQLSPVFAKAVIGVLASDPTARPAMDAIQARENGNDRMVAILSQEFVTEMRKHYPELKQRAAQEYGAAFTLDELNALVGFYSSGPGLKALRLMPELQQKLSAEGQSAGRAAGEAAGRRAFERAAREILDVQPKPKA